MAVGCSLVTIFKKEWTLALSSTVKVRSSLTGNVNLSGVGVDRASGICNAGRGRWGERARNFLLTGFSFF